MPLSGPSPNLLAGPIGFYGATPVSQPGPYTTSYPTMTYAMSAYSANTQTSAYTGGLLDLLQAARLGDLNTLRVAVENLRTLAESSAQNHLRLVADLKTMGLLG